VYDLYNEDGPNPLKIDRLYSWLESGSFLGTGYDTLQVFSLLMVIAFPIGLLAAYRISNRPDVETQPT
jgi:hypothetical protein